ncbi:MAG: hypothetical protein R2912_04310 [Eubacteriales bacterium]
MQYVGETEAVLPFDRMEHNIAEKLLRLSQGQSRIRSLTLPPCSPQKLELSAQQRGTRC